MSKWVDKSTVSSAAIRQLCSILHSTYSKKREGLRRLVYCAPFFNKEDELWYIELKRSGSKQEFAIRVNSTVMNTELISKITSGVEDFLSGKYDE